MKMKQNSGFTLLEVMVTIAVLTILLGIAAPSFQSIIQNSRLDNAARNLYATFNSARQEAIASGQKGFVCRSEDNPIDVDNLNCSNQDRSNWNFGLIAYRTLPGMILPAPNNSFGNQRINSGNFPTTTQDQRNQMTMRVSDFKDNGVEFVSNSNESVVVFNANGSLANTAPFRVAICDSREEAEGKYVEINAVGRVFLRSLEGSDLSCDNPE